MSSNIISNNKKSTCIFGVQYASTKYRGGDRSSPPPPAFRSDLNEYLQSAKIRLHWKAAATSRQNLSRQSATFESKATFESGGYLRVPDADSYKRRLKLILCDALRYQQGLSPSPPASPLASSPPQPLDSKISSDCKVIISPVECAPVKGPTDQPLSVISPALVRNVFVDIDTIFLPDVATAGLLKAYDSSKKQLLDLNLYQPRC